MIQKTNQLLREKTMSDDVRLGCLWEIKNILISGKNNKQLNKMGARVPTQNDHLDSDYRNDIQNMSRKMVVWESARNII